MSLIRYYAILFVTIFVLRSEISEGILFDYLVVEEKRRSDDQEEYCRSQEYDGLAIINTPESYDYAMKITQYARETLNQGVYVGIHYKQQVGDVTLDDGTAPPADFPWKKGVYVSDPLQPYTHLRRAGCFTMGDGQGKRFGLCGDYSSMKTETHGTRVLGQQLSGVSSSLTTRTVSSFLECSLLCGQDYRCRAAEFNKVLSKCLVLGPNSFTGLTPNTACQTFIRTSF